MRKGFVVDSLARTGSTTLARALSCHPEIKCLVEPFHPQRYEGQFHRMAVDAKSVEPALTLIWHRWSGIKHVWNATRGFPFPQNPRLNDGIVLAAGRIILLERRNLLRRYVSGVISQQLEFWIGTRQEFLARLEHFQLKELDPATVMQEIRQDKAAMEHRLRLIKEQKVPVMHLFYEDIFQSEICTGKQLGSMNDILKFLGYREVSEEEFRLEWLPLFDRNKYQWASADTYRLIPAIERLEHEVGSDETGWLFR